MIVVAVTGVRSLWFGCGSEWVIGVWDLTTVAGNRWALRGKMVVAIICSWWLG